MLSEMKNFLSFAIEEIVSQKNFSKSKKIFQKDFPKEFFNFQKNFLERAQGNFLAFDYAVKNLINGGGSHEETQEDERQKHSHYPSA